MRLHWNGERGLTEEEENRIFEIHDQAEGSNFLTTFSVIITIKDVGDWQDDFEALLWSYFLALCVGEVGALKQYRSILG